MTSIITKLVGLVLATMLGIYILSPGLRHKVLLSVAPVAAGEAAVKPAEPIIPAVTVVKPKASVVTESVVVSGSLEPREEIMVAAEVDGLSIEELLAEEGDKVEKGQVLARLSKATLEAQLSQNTAQILRAEAAIAQAQSQIAEAEALVAASINARTRAGKLAKSGYGSAATLEQAISANELATARVATAKKFVEASKAEKAVAESQRAELEWRLARADVVAPAAGIVSQRSARLGQIAAMAGAPMFRLIADGEIELEAEVADVDLPRVKQGQAAQVTPVGYKSAVTGVVRLVMPEVDRVTRLGKIRIALEGEQGLAVGGFAKGYVEVARRDGLTVPLSAVYYQDGAPFVQIVAEGIVRSRAVTIGHVDGDRAEVEHGLSVDDAVVLKAGTFLREGDKVSPAEPLVKSAGP